MKIQPLRAPVLKNCRGPYALFAEAEVTVSDTELHGTSWIGFGSYMNSGLIRSYCQIGRYCSIGRNVTIGLGHHDLSALSTSSWFPTVGPSTLPLAQKDPKRRVIIGHDVWIDDDVKISSGVTIGTGAVLAASSVVTRDVAPYEIVGGVPARSIKTRWPDELVRALLDSEWWSYDPHVLREIYDAVPEIVLERLKERSSSAARFEPKHVKLTPAPAPVTPIPETPAAAELKRTGPALLSANTFSPLQAKPGLGYRADLRFAEPIKDEGLVWEVRTDQGLIQRRFLTRGDRDKFVFFRMPADQHQVTMRVCEEAGKTHDLEIDRVALKEVDFHDADDSFAFSDDTVVACIASYPPRREMLKATIETLIDQVDHVCVYLNGYKDVPDHILEWAAKGRLSYVISSENRLRAAAKFLWLDRPGYFLLCDDDILFPPDYAAVMRCALDEKGRKAVIGLMAVDFEKTPEGLTTRKTYTAFNNACRTARRVHLLGTGVMALHSNAVAHMDHARLLSEPIDNDEIFAIEAQRCGVPLWCVERAAHWVRPNPNMIYGIREEVAIDPSKRLHRSRLLSSVAVWPDLDPAPLEGFVPNKTVLANFESAVDKLAECSTDRLSVLQIGACDGVQFDPLNALVRRHNLCGLFFEPVRHLFEALQQTYKDQEDCVFINMAISDKTEQATLRYVDPKAIEDGKVPGWSTGLGTLVEGANAIDGAGGVADETVRAIAQHTLSERVRTLAFDELAKWSHCADLDILVTDAEGYDAYFLERLAEGVMRPRIVLSETMLLSKARVTELRNGLIACGYEVMCGRGYLLAKLGGI